MGSMLATRCLKRRGSGRSRGNRKGVRSRAVARSKVLRVVRRHLSLKSLRRRSQVLRLLSVVRLKLLMVNSRLQLLICVTNAAPSHSLSKYRIMLLSSLNQKASRLLRKVLGTRGAASSQRSSQRLLMLRLILIPWPLLLCQIHNRKFNRRLRVSVNKGIKNLRLIRKLLMTSRRTILSLLIKKLRSRVRIRPGLSRLEVKIGNSILFVIICYLEFGRLRNQLIRKSSRLLSSPKPGPLTRTRISIRAVTRSVTLRTVLMATRTREEATEDEGASRTQVAMINLSTNELLTTRMATI